MKIQRTLLVSITALILMSSSLAQTLTSRVRSTYDQFRTAVERFDAEAVRSMVDPGFRLVLPNGTVLGRAAYLKGLEDRKAIASGVPSHSFTLSRVREGKDFVIANVVLTLTSKFVDGNDVVHDLRVVERKTVTFKREPSGLKVIKIEAAEVRTVIDGKIASTQRRG